MADFIQEVLFFFSLVSRVRSTRPEVLKLLSERLPPLTPLNIEDIREALSQTAMSARDEGEQLAKWLNRILQSTELQSSPYVSQVKDTGYPLNIWYLLLAHGDSLHRSTQPTSLDSPEDSALLAVLWSALGCLLQYFSTRLFGWKAM